MVQIRANNITDLVEQLNRYINQNASDLARIKNSVAPVSSGAVSPGLNPYNTITPPPTIDGVTVISGSDQIDMSDLNTKLSNMSKQINDLRDTVNKILNIKPQR